MKNIKIYKNLKYLNFHNFKLNPVKLTLNGNITREAPLVNVTTKFDQNLKCLFDF